MRAAGEADAASQGVNLSQGKRLQIFGVFFHSLLWNGNFHSANECIWTAAVRLQTEVTDFERGWTKSKREGVAWLSAAGTKSWPRKARALTGPPHNTAFQGTGVGQLSYVLWCFLTVQQVSWCPPCHPSLGQPQTLPREGERRVWLRVAGCRSLCSISPACLPPFHHMVQQVRCISILLGCKRAGPGFPCLSRC